MATPTTAIVPPKDCYLCNPDEELVFLTSGQSLALSGLGPVVKGYSVVATRSHIRSAADATLLDFDEFIDFALRIRSFLSEAFDTECLITEHGRVPVCDDVFGLGLNDPHCFHAHFLMFPGVPSIEQNARNHFGRIAQVSSLREALEEAAGSEEYMLVSPTPDRFLVMTGPDQIPRQFARSLVANALGRPELARWYQYPFREQAAETAIELQALLQRAKE